ncbi:MAG: 4Fe-4S binding protein [Sphaerochaetaceae bacterium]|nr:4Fe-4S binding protein [Sphaerochaetaceae bacterium]
MNSDSLYEQGVKVSGAMSLKELKSSRCYKLPSKERTALAAVIECIEEIPCNPCETACPRHAITVGASITNVPVVDLDACNGCGLCVAACPGLAIYLKKYEVRPSVAYIAFPYEYLPLPLEGQRVTMVDRLGANVCEGTVVKVVDIPRNDRTVIIHAEYPNRYYEQVVSIERLSR